MGQTKIAGNRRGIGEIGKGIRKVLEITNYRNIYRSGKCQIYGCVP